MIELLYILIYILVVVAIGAVVLWAIDQLGVEEPLRRIVRVIVVLICLLVVVGLLLNMIGAVRLYPLR